MATIRIAKTTVGYFRVGGMLGNHIPFPRKDKLNTSIFGKLVKKGLFRPFPVAEGETFLITGVAQAGAVQCVIYDLYEAGDVRPDEPNGSKSDEYDMINYGRCSTILVDGDNRYELNQNPAEFPDFPFGGVVPANKQIDIKGILFSDIAKESNTGANKQITQYLKFIKDRTVLFDEERNGFPYIGLLPGSDITSVGTGQSVGGNYSDVDHREELILPEVLTFSAGEELSVIVNTDVVGGAAIITPEEAEIGLIQTVRRIA